MTQPDSRLAAQEARRVARASQPAAGPRPADRLELLAAAVLHHQQAGFAPIGARGRHRGRGDPRPAAWRRSSWPQRPRRTGGLAGEHLVEALIGGGLVLVMTQLLFPLDPIKARQPGPPSPCSTGSPMPWHRPRPVWPPLIVSGPARPWSGAVPSTRWSATSSRRSPSAIRSLVLPPFRAGRWARLTRMPARPGRSAPPVPQHSGPGPVGDGAAGRRPGPRPGPGGRGQGPRRGRSRTLGE